MCTGHVHRTACPVRRACEACEDGRVRCARRRDVRGAHVHTMGYRLHRCACACTRPHDGVPPAHAPTCPAGLLPAVSRRRRRGRRICHVRVQQGGHHRCCPPPRPPLCCHRAMATQRRSTDAQTRKDIQTPRHYPDTHPSSTLIPFRCPPDGLYTRCLRPHRSVPSPLAPPIYGQINGSWACGGDSRLLVGHLRERMGFEGFVMSDWWALDPIPVSAANNGVDQVSSP